VICHKGRCIIKARDFLKRLAKEKDNLFFSAIRTKRAIDLNERITGHDWIQRGCKIYPSSIKSLTMCPKKHLEEEVHKPPSFPLSSMYLMEIGKTVHTLIQDTSMAVEPYTEMVEGVASEYLEQVDHYVRNTYKADCLNMKNKSFLYSRPRDLGEMLEKKLAKFWPEVPGYDEESGFSFRCDLVLNIEDHPAILDIKTTSVEPDRWKLLTGENRVPTEEYKLQVRLYRHFLNKHKYYDKPIKKVGIAYVNLLMKFGSEGSEFEWWSDMGEDEDMEVAELVKHLTLHRNAVLSKIPIECTYDKCFEHTKED